MCGGRPVHCGARRDERRRGAAAAGIPVTHRGVTQELTIVSGPPDDPACAVDWDRLAAGRGTIVVLMGVYQLRDRRTPGRQRAEAGHPGSGDPEWHDSRLSHPGSRPLSYHLGG